MIDRAARKISQLGAQGGNAGLSFLIGIADDGISVRDIKVVADQGHAERRVEMVQEHGSQLGDAVAIGVAQQRNAVCVLGLGSGEPLYPASDDVLGPVNRRLWTVALNHQHVSIWENVEGPRMLKAG